MKFRSATDVVGRINMRLQPRGNDLRRQAKVIETMLQEGEALLDRARLLAHLQEFGLSGSTAAWKGLASYADWINTSVVGPLQIPTEMVDYLLYAGRHRPASVAEIGVANGGMATFSAAFFQALNPACQYHCIDIKDRFYVLPRIRERLNFAFHIPSTSDDHAGKVFDVVFIDGHHSYGWAKRDYLNMGRHAKMICAFHDIHGQEYVSEEGGIFGFWRELRATEARQSTMIEFSHAVPGEGVGPRGLWMGIGIIDRTTTRGLPLATA